MFEWISSQCIEFSSYAGKWGNHCNALLSNFLHVLMGSKCEDRSVWIKVFVHLYRFTDFFFSVKYGSNEILHFHLYWSVISIMYFDTIYS